MGEGSQMPEPLALPTEFSPSVLLGSIRAQETISKPCVYVHFLMFGASIQFSNNNYPEGSGYYGFSI